MVRAVLLFLAPLVLLTPTQTETKRKECGIVKGLNKGKCPEGQCCSFTGICGTSAGICGDGCQFPYGRCTHETLPISTDGKCGKEANARCPIALSGNRCCSEEGECGKSPKHCKMGCQKRYGHCDRPRTMISECTEPGMFALTFDDGPHKNTPGLLRLLKKYEIKATFFVVGQKLDDSANVKTLKDIHRQGHQIASHTNTHPDLSKLTQGKVKAEMVKLDNRLKEILGFTPIYMRPPFGSANMEVREWLHALGYKAAWLNIDTKDFEHKDGAKSLKAITDALKNASPEEKSFITLNHDQVASSTNEEFIEAVAKLVKKKKFKFVTIGECNGQPNPKKWYKHGTKFK